MNDGLAKNHTMKPMYSMYAIYLYTNASMYYKYSVLTAKDLRK